MHIGATRLSLALFSHPSMPESVKAGRISEKLWPMPRFTVELYLMSHLDVKDVVQLMLDLPEKDFTNTYESFHCYFLYQLKQDKISVNEVVKLYLDKGCARRKDLYLWSHSDSDSDFDDIIRICLERYHELSSKGQIQFHTLLDALFTQYSRWPSCQDVWQEFKIALILIRLAKEEKLTENDCEIFFKGDLQKTPQNPAWLERYIHGERVTEEDNEIFLRAHVQATLERISRYGKDVPAAKELVNAHAGLPLTTDDLTEFNKLKKQLPPMVIMRLLNDSFRQEKPCNSDSLFDLVMAKPVIKESKDEAVHEENDRLRRNLQPLLSNFLN